MDYLSRDGSKSFHLFISGNTACKMWKSGGINTQRKSWKLYSSIPKDKQICTMCNNKKGN